MLESDLPMVSVIAPCRNEARFVENTLKSILQGNYPADRMELLVVDGMSTDGTREIVSEMAKQDSRIRLLDNPKKIVPSAMNIGIKAARGEYIARIDCHSTFASDYISKCIEVSRRTGAENVGGYGVTLPGADTDVASAIATATSNIFGVGDSKFRLTGPEQEVDTVPFGAYRKALFERIGLYDERLSRNQDIELNSRIRKAGGRIIISPEIKLSYYNRGNYRGLWQQAFNNGLWNPYTIWFVGGGLSLRHFVPMFFVLGLIAFLIGAFFGSPFKWVFLGYVLLYLSIGSVFAVQCARQARVSAFWVLVSFLVLHVAYGLGSLWGVMTIPFKFPRRYEKFVGKPLSDRKT
jgi:glycosyltransferase involved in cell wall biosynthesis